MLRAYYRRMNEGGVVLSMDEWHDLGVVGQNIWLQERERVQRMHVALLSHTIADAIAGGDLPTDMVWEELPENVQSNVLKMRATRNATLQRFAGA